MANNRIAYGLAKQYGINTEGMEPKQVWDALAGKGINQGNYQQYQNRQNESYNNILKSSINNNTNTERSQEEQDLLDQLSRGEYLEIEELKNHPVVKMLEEKSKQTYEKYGDTSELPGREKKREQWKQEFLSHGSVVDKDGKDLSGPIKKEFRAVIVTGLPAAGKSSKIVNPLSKEIGGFVFDNDEIKGLIDEFKESGGAAAQSVHDESKLIQEDAFKEFLTGGGRNGDNLIIPKIGDDANDLQTKLIDKLEKAGYDVEIQYNPAPLKDSMNRVVMRGIKTGRIIPLSVVEKYGDGPEKTYEHFKVKTNKQGKPFVRKEYK